MPITIALHVNDCKNKATCYCNLRRDINSAISWKNNYLIYKRETETQDRETEGERHREIHRERRRHLSIAPIMCARSASEIPTSVLKKSLVSLQAVCSGSVNPQSLIKDTACYWADHHVTPESKTLNTFFPCCLRAFSAWLCSLSRYICAARLLYFCWASDDVHPCWWKKAFCTSTPNHMSGYIKQVNGRMHCQYILYALKVYHGFSSQGVRHSVTWISCS